MDLARLYMDTDYDAVKALMDEEKALFPFRNELGGTGVVVEKEGKVVGFAWALTSESSSVCHIDYFVVDKNFRKSQVGSALMTALFIRLQAMGKRIFMGSLRQDNEYSVPLARIYQECGVVLADKLYFVSGEIDTVLDGLKGRYD